MNHNQINHKLFPQFQTDNMALEHIWLRVSVYLVKKQQVDNLAQPAFGQTATENCIRESAWSAVNLFSKRHLCLRPRLIKASGEIHS